MHKTSITITIITVVKNCENSIEKTIQSIINQDYSDIEFLVIDGNSTDNTLKIINNYKQYINYIISESDFGIYDAMNKGIKLATGDYINFMNSGDVFYTRKTCSTIANTLQENRTDIIYGDVILSDIKNKNELILRAKPLKKLETEMAFHHQSSFFKTSILKKNPFNLKYKIVSDYDQVAKLYHLNKKFTYIPIIVSRISINGLSYSKLETTIEQIAVSKSYIKYSIKQIIFLQKIFFDIIRLVLGKKLTDKVRLFKWKLLTK